MESTENQTIDDQQLLAEFEAPTYEAWRELVEQQLKGAPFDKKVVTKTYEGINLQPLYRQNDLDGITHLNSFPGLPPYVRNSNALGYTQTPWQICQELPYSSAEEFNQAIKHDTERGQTAVTLTLDKTTLLGQDPDQAATGDVGFGGLSVATVDDLAKALDGIDLENTPVYVQASSAAMATTALFMALVKQQGKSTRKLQGGFEMDPLGILIDSGQLPRSVSGAYDVMANMFTWAKANAPQLQVVTVHGQPYSNSGASAVQELAFVLATAVEYLREMEARGLAIDDVAPRIRFSFAVGGNYFMEVAKLRAARLLWAKVVKAFGGSDASQKLTALHVSTARWNKTIHDPHVNLLRTTTEAFAGAVGGANSMHVSQFDETSGQPDEFSRRIARNTQLILQQEAHLTKVVDPAGGSWYVEKLTDALGRQVWSLFQEIEAAGGMYKAMQVDMPQTAIAQTEAQREASLSTRKDVLVGTNKYANLLEELPEPNLPDYELLHKKRAEYIADYRTSLNSTQSTAVMDRLATILEAADETVLDAAIEAALAGATIGEISRTLRTGDETKATVTPLPARRGAEKFEAMRAFAEQYLAKNGHRPQVFLANMGPIPSHKPRADFSTDFFQVGGFEVLGNNGFDTPQAAAEAAIASGAPVVVICGTDKEYPDVVPPITQAVKAANPDTTVILAGYPKDQIDAHKEAGVDEFIHIRANVVDVLSGLQSKIGGTE